MRPRATAFSLQRIPGSRSRSRPSTAIPLPSKASRLPRSWRTSNSLLILFVRPELEHRSKQGPARRQIMELAPSFLCRSTLGLAVALVVAGTAVACSVPHWARESESARFMAENAAAMDKMMAGMAITPSGDVDRDFVAMMVSHHQGAIEIAQAELRYGRNEQLRRLAQEIVVTQRQEIVAMRLSVGLPPSLFTSSPDTHQETTK